MGIVIYSHDICRDLSHDLSRDFSPSWHFTDVMTCRCCDTKSLSNDISNEDIMTSNVPCHCTSTASAGMTSDRFSVPHLHLYIRHDIGSSFLQINRCTGVIPSNTEPSSNIISWIYKKSGLKKTYKLLKIQFRIQWILANLIIVKIYN